MLTKCAVFGCRGNYKGEPYSPVVKFPENDPNTKNLWLDSMPNDRKSLEDKKTIYICLKHFDCPLVKVKGGKRPAGPPTIFEGVKKSCLKQVKVKPRVTQKTSASVKSENKEKHEKEKDKIKDFKSFNYFLKRKYPTFMFNDINNKEMTMYKTDNLGKSVLYFIQFQEVISPIGFLKVVSVEKNGIEVPKMCLGIPRNSLIHCWTQIEEMLSHLYKYEHQNQYIW